MTRFLFILTIFFLFIIEGTIIQVFSPERWGWPVAMTPRFVVVFVIFSALFLGRVQGLFMGLVFGLIYDIVYGSVIGIYAFSMAIVGYFSGLTFRIFQQNIFLILCTTLVLLVVFEFIIYGMFSLLTFTQMNIQEFFFQKVIPSLVLNMIFALLVSYPARLILLQVQEEEN